MHDTIAAVSTPVGEGGIGIVRLSGKNVFRIADKIFISKDKKKPSGCKTYTLHYGYIINKKVQNEIIDEVLLTVMKSPKSYTKEDIVEINCHGGIVPLRKILDLTLKLGARLAEPGEFTKRAFLNGRIDLAQAEAVLDVIQSKTEDSMRIAVEQLEGRLSVEIRALKEETLDIQSEIEASLDFSEEDIISTSREDILNKLDKVSKSIKKLIDDTWKGMIMREGILCVIAGKPNVGKSSLMNAFLKRNRVIVTPVPGTTRDAIEEEVSLEGIPLRLVDTAGISKARDLVERHGIKKSKSYIKKADLIIFMLDASKPWGTSDAKILKDIKGKNYIILLNKCDLKTRLDFNRVKKSLLKNVPIIEISLKKKKNLEKLEKAILNKVWHGDIQKSEGAFVTNIRHKKALEGAHKSLRKARAILEKEKGHSPEVVASFLRETVMFLGSILGDTVEPDILGRIFSKFCVGK